MDFCSPCFIVASFAPLNNDMTKSLIDTFDLGSSIPRGRKLVAQSWLYFSYEARDTNWEGYAPVGPRPMIKELVLPVPDESLNASGTGQNIKVFRIVL